MAEEQIGRHKGSVETLLHEKKELSRLLQIVNSQLERHLAALEDAGVDTDSFIEELQQEGQESRKKSEEQQRHQKQGGRKEQSSQQRSPDQESTETPDQEEDEDVEDFFEDDDEVDRDFNPNA